MTLNAAAHRKIASEYRQRAEAALTDKERDDLMRMAQEHLLLASPDPLMMSPRGQTGW